MPVLDVFKDEGKFYAYGKIESGTIFEDMYVTVMPHRKTI
jgi:translation elongation factor EF-1alpha